MYVLVLSFLRQFKTCRSLKLSSYKIDLVISDLTFMFIFSGMSRNATHRFPFMLSLKSG